MVSSTLNQEFEMDYDVSYRDLEVAQSGRDMTSKERFRAKARHSRSGRRSNLVSGAHRRRDKRNYL